MKILITGLMARIDQIAQAVGANATSAQPAATDTSPPAEGQASTLPNTVNPVATLQQESAMADAKQFAQMRAEIDETRKEMARLRAENLEAKWSARVKQDVVQLAQEGRAIDTAATEAALLEYAREGGNAVYALRLKELREQYPEGERPHRAMTFAQQGSTPGVRIPKTLVRFHKELGPTSKAYQFAAERHDVEVGLGNTDPTKLEATIIKALRVRGLISEADGSMTLTAKGR